jgi:phosphoglucosamine mutase
MEGGERVAQGGPFAQGGTAAGGGPTRAGGGPTAAGRGTPAAGGIRKLFGTDGVRGVAGEFLTAELATALGRAATRIAASDTPQVLIVRDTRESGEMLEAALAAGVAAAGGHALLGGVLPTPGASVLTLRFGFDLAAVVSASHNPYADNGIKFFGPGGTKLSDDQEAEIERLIAEPAAGRMGRVRELHGAAGDYLRELERRFADLDLSGRRVLLDCANGATHRVAPEIFRRLGAEVDAVAVEPDGRNINHGCGSTHVEELVARMAGHDVGFAFDGDGDRVLAVDRNGKVVDGDELMALAALHLRAFDRLPGNGVAVTVMTNYGFHRSMREHGVKVATTPVGDRHVLAELLLRGWALGGEQSGHIIDTGFVPAGDGTAAALLALEALGEGDLAERRAMEKLPQRLVNVRVADRDALEGAATVWAAVGEESARLEGRGRVLVRSSGTEPLVRVMVEAPREDECQEIVDRLANLVRAELG